MASEPQNGQNISLNLGDPVEFGGVFNPVNILNILAKELAAGKGATARDRPEEARVQDYEPTNPADRRDSPMPGVMPGTW